MHDLTDLAPGFRTGEWLVFPARGAIRRDGDGSAKEQTPEPLVFELLLLLAARNGELVSKEELIEQVWNNRAMSDAPINRCVTQLRKALGDKERPYRYVENVSRRGYRLKTPVELHVDQDTRVATDELPRNPERSRHFARWGLASLAGLIAATLLVVIFGWPGSPGIPPTASERQTIGVLPFKNLSSAGGSDYLVGGFKEELVNSLHSVPGLLIVNSRLAYHDLATTEVAEKLGVSVLIGGSVQRTGDRLKINYMMSNAADGVVLSTGVLEGSVETLFELQSELAILVRNQVLGDSSQVRITRSKPTSFRAYDTYMRGLFAFDRRQTSTSLDDAIELFEQTIDLDPSFGPAYVMLATSYTLLPTYRSVSIEEARTLALPVLDRGTRVDATIRDTAGAVRGFFHHMERDWEASERAYRRAVAADVVDPTALLWYSRMLASVGRLEDSLKFAKQAVQMEPTSAMITSRVAMAYTWLGDYDSANEYFERANMLGAGGQTYLLAYALCLYQRGEIEKSYAVTMAASESAGAETSWIKPVYAAFQDPAVADAALDEISAGMESGTLPPQVALIARALFGDADAAYQVAERLSLEGEIFEMDLLFIPETKALREYEEFDTLTDKLGLKDYWQNNSCAWQGQSFACRT